VLGQARHKGHSKLAERHYPIQSAELIADLYSGMEVISISVVVPFAVYLIRKAMSRMKSLVLGKRSV
jgi:two-component SAPR family response regulator